MTTEEFKKKMAETDALMLGGKITPIEYANRIQKIMLSLAKETGYLP
jgi:hypothetical protein